MCVHLCNCKFDGLILMVSLDFKTSGKMFTQRGGVCNGLEIISKMRQASGDDLDLAHETKGFY